MYKIGLIFFAFFAFSQTLAIEFPSGVFKTPNGSYHNYNASTASNDSTPFHGRFRFRVKASENISISLSHRSDTNNFEFIIGARNNNDTRIRINNTDHVIMKTPKILTVDKFQTFEIHWSDNIFHFAQIHEKENDMTNLMLFKNKYVFPIYYIGLKGADNTQWLVHESMYGESPRIFDSYLKTMNRTVLQIGNSLRCMVIETKTDSKPIYVRTDSNSEYKNYSYVQVPEQSCYNVFVRAELAAHVALSNYPNRSHPMVELNFRPQGSFNLTYDYKSNEIGTIFNRDLLNGQEYSGYWFEFDQSSGNLSVGKIGESSLISRNIELFPINYIGVSTTNGNVGDWIIKKHGSCPGNKDDDIHDDGFWGDARTRCYIENPLDRSSDGNMLNQ